MITVGGGDDLTVSQALARVVFVVTVRNNATLLEDCLSSVAAQDHPLLHCVVVDDASDDGTLAVARRWLRRRSDLFSVQSRQRQFGKMANLVAAIADLDDHDVVVELDGDDRLLVPDAASDLARLHQRADLVWTQHRVARWQWDDWVHWRSTDLPALHRNRADMPRLAWSRTWYPGHLRSFKAWAFRLIECDDLKVGGLWVHAAADAAYYTPLVEMTAPELRYFYDRELAIYNVTRQNDHFRERDPAAVIHRQSDIALLIASRAPYRTRWNPQWIGLLDSATHVAVMAACVDQLKVDPGTRILLGTSGGVVKRSNHPRVQIVSIPPQSYTERSRDNLEPLMALATTSLGRPVRKRYPLPGLPLVEL